MVILETDIGKFEVPDYLKNDILALEKGLRDKVSYIDCLQNEVYGSINTALVSRCITNEQAIFLRQKFVFNKDLFIQ